MSEDQTTTAHQYHVGATIRFPRGTGLPCRITAVDGDQVTFAYLHDPEDSATEAAADLDAVGVVICD